MIQTPKFQRKCFRRLIAVGTNKTIFYSLEKVKVCQQSSLRSKKPTKTNLTFNNSMSNDEWDFDDFDETPSSTTKKQAGGYKSAFDLIEPKPSNQSFSTRNKNLRKKLKSRQNDWDLDFEDEHKPPQKAFTKPRATPISSSNNPRNQSKRTSQGWMNQAQAKPAKQPKMTSNHNKNDDDDDLDSWDMEDDDDKDGLNQKGGFVVNNVMQYNNRNWNQQSSSGKK